MFTNINRIAKQTVDKALTDQFYTMCNRFDVTSPKYHDFRLYGRVTSHLGETVTMIQSVGFPEKLQGKGLFNAICKAFRNHPETAGNRIYIQSVQNESWLAHLRNSPNWVEVTPTNFISTK